jgi:hypothetical protein
MNEVQYCDKLLYKYRSINQNTDRLLKYNELYFSHPDEFNDPFDCKVDYFHKGTRDKWVDFFCQFDKMHPVKASNHVKDCLKNGTLKQRKEGIVLKKRIKFDEGNFLRACCFSETEKSVLMWSHYTQKHEGICLSFKSYYAGDYYLPLDSEYALPFNKVNYFDDRPKAVNLLDMSNTPEIKRIISDFFVTKFTHWQYENEYRLLETMNSLGGKSTVNFQKDALQGIIFGLRVKPDDAQHIKDIVDEYYKGIAVKMYRTEKVKGEYAIAIKEIKDFSKYIKLLDNKV